MGKPLIRKLKLADIELAAYNPRTIEDQNFAGLRASLDEFGLLEMPVVNTQGQKLRAVSGHQRIRALGKEGFTYADCLCVEFDDLTERSANLAMNNPAIRGKWDVKKAIPMLDAIIGQKLKDDPLGFNRLRKELKVYASRDPKQMAVNQPDDTPSLSKPGEVYELGAHLLACGDATDADLVARLQGTQPFAACITDPPFGVAYKRDSEAVDLENDALTPEKWLAMMHEACGLILSATDGPTYLFSASKHFALLDEVWRNCGGAIFQWLAWTKTNPVVFVTQQTDFRSQYEWVLYGAAEKRLPDLPVPDVRRTNVLPFPKPSTNKLHPTQKPLDLIASLVKDVPGEGPIFDPFAGSGTTMAACESASRASVSIEIDPRYCDVIRKRWAEAKHGPEVDWVSLTPVLDV